MKQIAHIRGWSAFSTLLWVVFLVVAFYLFIWPPLQGVVVVRSWNKVPCYISQKANNPQYFFTVGETNYYSLRFNLWQVQNMLPVVTRPDSTYTQPNATCYVHLDSAAKATNAVLNPQASPDVGILIDRIALGAVVFVAVLALDIQSRRARRKNAAAKIGNTP